MKPSRDIPVRIHPRAFSSFGEELITNDTVAIIELVKNSYDAYALNVEIVIGEKPNGDQYLKITDDGCGMTEDTIRSAWATIATPFKKKNPTISRVVDGKKRIRVVTGNKGLGRFSAARLGKVMSMITKSDSDQCIEARFDWDMFDQAETISDCKITLLDCEKDPFEVKNGTGTIIKIPKLKTKWDKDKIESLVAELSRFINPFEDINDFSITIKTFLFDEEIAIKPNEFINNPVYCITGSVSQTGTLHWDYTFSSGAQKRSSSGIVLWNTKSYENEALPSYTCGEFNFEIRVWDLDAESIEALSGRFSIGKSDLRDYIKRFKGLSVYRDHVLVLPKSDSSRDWLGIDARRISRVGKRISTSQIVGIVNISNERNPQLKDTTDREKLAFTPEYEQFVFILDTVISVIQNEREKDKTDNKKKSTLSDLITPLSSRTLVEKAEQLVEKGSSAEEVLKAVVKYDEENARQLEDLNERLVYYAQTASLGSIAIVIMHEILSGMTVIKRFLNKAKGYLEMFDQRTKSYLGDAENSHKRLLEVADSFTPLYNRDLRKKEYKCDLRLAITKSVRLVKAKKISADIYFDYSDIDEELLVGINEGELETILINLLDNACYWIKDSQNIDQRVLIKAEKQKNSDRISVSVSDSGSGILPEDAERIFLPGITSKPKGIGMGLVIVNELVSAYGGKTGVRIPGDINGATLVFDLPIKKR